LTRSQGFPPGGILSLGQVLSDAYDPNTALMAEGPISVPSSIQIDKTTQTDVIMATDERLFAALEAWVKTNGLPVVAGAEVQASEQRQAARVFQLESLESEMFQPSEEYANAALNSRDARSQTWWWKLRNRIFMVTGVRIAKGAALMETGQAQSIVWLAAKGGGSAQNAPVEGGVAGGRGKGTFDLHAAKRIGDFVYAYRLHEITYMLGWVFRKPIKGETAAVEKKAPEARGGGKEDDQQKSRREEIEREPEVNGISIGEPFEGFGQNDDPELVE
jgi:hypothetical protein